MIFLRLRDVLRVFIHTTSSGRAPACTGRRVVIQNDTLLRYNISQTVISETIHNVMHTIAHLESNVCVTSCRLRVSVCPLGSAVAVAAVAVAARLVVAVPTLPSSSCCFHSFVKNIGKGDFDLRFLRLHATPPSGELSLHLNTVSAVSHFITFSR